MTRSAAWFTDKIAHTQHELADGDGCHADEAYALSDYLDGLISTEDTAKLITAPILAEKEPSRCTFRLWALLSEAIVELSAEDRHKTLDLLCQIKTLPSSCGIEWAQLRGRDATFYSMWDTLYRLHHHGGDSCGGWNINVESFEDYLADISQQFEAIGRAEAELFVRGLGSAYWGYRVLDLVYRGQPGIEIWISEIFGWLDGAGGRLKEDAMSNNVVERFHHGNATMMEHWAGWKMKMLRLSGEDSSLLERGKRMAASCYELM
ncbi:hypothetical protein Q7P37_009220 [Cladosporium fusiforme]